MNTEFEEQLTEAMAECSDDPYSFVMLAFPWGTGALEGKRPEEWQVQLLKDIRDKLLTVQEALKFALASGHGIGNPLLMPANSARGCIPASIWKNTPAAQRLSLICTL